MSHPPINRSVLVTKLVELARGSNVLIGRGSAPRAGGWDAQGVGVGEFVPYAVIKAGQATTPAGGEPDRIRQYASSWDCYVQIIGHAETEEVADATAHAATCAVMELNGDLDLQGQSWTVQRVNVVRLNPTEWSNQDKAWRTTYEVSLHLSLKSTG